jgi:hypothetical protein
VLPVCSFDDVRCCICNTCEVPPDRGSIGPDFGTDAPETPASPPELGGDRCPSWPVQMAPMKVEPESVSHLGILGRQTPDDPWIRRHLRPFATELVPRPDPVVSVEHVPELVELDRDQDAALSDVALERCELLGRETGHDLVRSRPGP